MRAAPSEGVARKCRIKVFPGAVVHAWARRVDRWPLFADQDDYSKYVALLADVVDRFDWILLSFCLMPNHVHMLIELRQPNLDKGMHSVHSRYARWFNDRHDRVGRLFEHRYDAKLVEDELYFLTVAQYIEQNPVKGGLANDPASWPWSSRGLIAAHGCPPWIADDLLTARRMSL